MQIQVLKLYYKGKLITKYIDLETNTEYQPTNGCNLNYTDNLNIDCVKLCGKCDQYEIRIGCDGEKLYVIPNVNYGNIISYEWYGGTYNSGSANNLLSTDPEYYNISQSDYLLTVELDNGCIYNSPIFSYDDPSLVIGTPNPSS